MICKQIAIPIISALLSPCLFFGQESAGPHGVLHDPDSMATASTRGQHDHTHTSQCGMDTAGMDMPDMQHDQADAHPAHFASGTSWQPASTPHTAWMWQWGSWNFMAHGVLFLTYNQQGGPRGAGKLESVNWMMFDEQRKLGRGSLEFRQMLSAEALTAPHGGFRELFQTGETYHGRPLVDMQHPHDLFGELSVTYNLPLTEHTSLLFYGAPAGEPALGPAAYVHRASAG